MKQLKSFILLIFLCLFLTPAFADDDSYDDDSGVERQKIYHVYGNVDLVPTVKIVYDKPRIVVRANFPLLTSDNDNENIDEFNQQVSDIIAEEIKTFKNQVVDLRSSMQNQQTMPKGTKNDLTIDFDTSVINTNDKPIISIRFNIQGFITGQAHPFHRHRVLNFDLHDGEKIELSELFRNDFNYLDFLADYSRNILNKKLRDKDMITNGTAPTPDNYKNWNLNPGGLLITFDEYQVAPYVYGTQTVLIPYSAFKGAVSPDSPIARCLKHQKRCVGNKLLTGGFMDEA